MPLWHPAVVVAHCSARKRQTYTPNAIEFGSNPRHRYHFSAAVHLKKHNLV